MVHPVCHARLQRRSGEPDDHSRFAALRVIERLGHIDVGGQGPPQLHVPASRRPDERARSARPKLPKHPALRPARKRIRARVRSHGQREPWQGLRAEQHRSFDQIVPGAAHSGRVDLPLDIADGQLQSSEGQRAISADHRTRELRRAARELAADPRADYGHDPRRLERLSDERTGEETQARQQERASHGARG